MGPRQSAGNPILPSLPIYYRTGHEINAEILPKRLKSPDFPTSPGTLQVNLALFGRIPDMDLFNVVTVDHFS